MSIVRPSIWLVLFVQVALAAETSPPTLRLDPRVRPTRYRLTLQLDPNKDTFTGQQTISLALDRPRSVIWMHAVDLQITKATFLQGANETEAKVLMGGTENPDVIGLQALRAVEPKDLSVRLEFVGRVVKGATAGLFSAEVDQDKYLLTKFEPLDARRAFPCFDEPAFKVPWELTLEVPSQFEVVANMPVAKEMPLSERTKRVEFGVTPPLPPYLVAYAVGPWEFVDAGHAGKNHTPVRIVVPKGHKQQAKYAAEVTPVILDRLEKYFDIPYPYQKLDSIAVPVTFGFRAMENVGLIAYAQSLLLADPNDDAVWRQRDFASLATHEISHQWFGNLVTLDWWDDLWLNEAFATWLERKVVAEWKPDWQTANSTMAYMYRTKRLDRLSSARQIRQAIGTPSDIVNAFDAITYRKGAAVIAMFEQWMGADTFRKGIQNYLRRHRFGTTRSEDFFAALSVAARDRRLPAAFGTFLNQPGIPVVNGSVGCGPHPTVTLTQRRALEPAAKVEGNRVWQIPVCLRLTENGHRSQHCYLVEKPSQVFALQGSTGCPAIESLNVNGQGYYHVGYRSEELRHLSGTQVSTLTDLEKLALCADVEAAIHMQTAHFTDALALTPALANSTTRDLVIASMTPVYEAQRLLPDQYRAALEQFVRLHFGAIAYRLGWLPKPEDTPDDKLLRPLVLGLVASVGQDTGLRNQATEWTRGWLKTCGVLPLDIPTAVVVQAAEDGDAELFDQMHACLEASKHPDTRDVLFWALGSFRNPELKKRALNLILSPGAPILDSLGILWGAADQNDDRTPFLFLKSNFDSILARFPKGTSFELGASAPDIAQNLCSRADADDVEAFLEPRMKEYKGGQRRLKQVVEGIRACADRREREQVSLGKFFLSQPASK